MESLNGAEKCAESSVLAKRKQTPLANAAVDNVLAEFLMYEESSLGRKIAITPSQMRGSKQLPKLPNHMSLHNPLTALQPFLPSSRQITQHPPKREQQEKEITQQQSGRSVKRHNKSLLPHHYSFNHRYSLPAQITTPCSSLWLESSPVVRSENCVHYGKR
ncbi:hypothetical protein TNCT_94441 [Trichonephila clavata]|uniref:Uncharacterized protein n=1 Tax=Trichonephila clavata TaxID=2740835 RepID=A0A8X6GHF6_TRICU|nr:hypothetical protein TNCT_94441 [Trichonephila clavata]